MYILEKAKCKLDRRKDRWVEHDLSEAPVTTLLTTYGEVYLYIGYSIAGVSVTKGLSLRKTQELLNNVNPDTTVTQWLASLGNRTLPFEEKLLGDTLGLVRYSQAWHSGYRATPVGRNAHVESDIADSHKEDLLLSHPTLDLTNFTSKALVTVNGLFHLCDGSSEGIRVLDGNTNIRNVNDNQIGIYSFETVGTIKQIPIRSEMLSKLKADSPLYDGAYVTVPEDIDISDKTILLVVGGYLNVLNDSYYQISERTWRINLARMLLLDRMFQSREALNLKSLGLFDDLESPSLMSVTDLMSDSVIERYLTLSSSFLVVVDTVTFFQNYETLEYLRTPGRSVALTYDRMPLVGAYGRMMDYHVIKEPGRSVRYPKTDPLMVYCASLNIRDHYDNNTRPWLESKVANAGRYPVKPFTHEEYYFRIMGSES